MKVLFLNYEYPPLGGGASVATEAILKEWGEDPNMEVHLVTAGIGKEVEHVRVGEHVHIHRLPIGKDPSRLHSQSLRDIFVYSWKAWFFMRGLSSQKSFDITLAFFTVPCGFLAYLLKLFRGVPYVVSLRGADVPGFSEKYDQFYLFAKPLVRFLWAQAEKVIPNSIGIRTLARETNPVQLMEIIENGVDTENFQPKQSGKLMSPVIFISTSRLTPRKGIHFLIEAFALAVKQTSVPILLQLIGEGEQKELLETRVKELGIADRVQFLGRVEHYLLPQFYQKAHVFVLPSKNEGMSNSALEALASGLPLIVSGTGGMQELVTEGTNGCFIDPENTETFATTLVDLAQNETDLTAFGWESRRRAELRGWDKVAGHFKMILEQNTKK
jgi:glycosyltransferase involved in cell wall biosynthesis